MSTMVSRMSGRRFTMVKAAAMGEIPFGLDDVDAAAVQDPRDNFDVEAVWEPWLRLRVGLRGGGVDRYLHLEKGRSGGVVAEVDNQRSAARGEVPGAQLIRGARLVGSARRGEGLHRH